MKIRGGALAWAGRETLFVTTGMTGDNRLLQYQVLHNTDIGDGNTTTTRLILLSLHGL